MRGAGGGRSGREDLGKALPSERKGLGKGLPPKRKTLTKTVLSKLCHFIS